MVEYTYMKKTILILIILAALLIISGFYYFQKQPVKEEPQTEKNITVDFPKKNETLNFPFEIKGSARVFENTANVRIIDKTTNEYLYEGIITTDSKEMGEFGEFAKTIGYFYNMPESEDIIIEVLWFSPKDGSELDKVSIPIKVNMGDTDSVKVYFGNNIMDPQISCDKVYPVERIIPHTIAPAKESIELLLSGISSNEAEKGYSTSISYGVELQKLTIENGVAKADFNDVLLSYGGGSCSAIAIRSQIEETLKQFSSVNNVIISVNGDSEYILQP